MTYISVLNGINLAYECSKGGFYPLLGLSSMTQSKVFSLTQYKTKTPNEAHSILAPNIVCELSQLKNLMTHSSS